MSQPHPFVKYHGLNARWRFAGHQAGKKPDQGFTLVELMIGMVIGLLSTLAITQILLVSEGQKRSTTSGSDAQIGGLLALDALRQSIQMAGYGFASARTSIGCPLEAKFNGTGVAGFPANLVPVEITNGANDAPDEIRVVSSSKTSYSVPISIIDPGYQFADATKNKAFPVASAFGVAAGDLMVAVIDSTTNCQVFQVTSAPIGEQIDRADNAALWNPAGFPDQNYSFGQYLVNLGALDDVTFSVSAAGSLQSNKFLLAANSTPSYSGAVDLAAHVVNLQAYYGKDTDANDTIDTWDAVTPTTNAGWLQISAIRIAIVSRSNQFEKEEVTAADPLWVVGADSVITGAASCGTSKCVTLKVPRPSGSTDWKHYRYKTFDSIIPLRNLIWHQ